jgi:Ni/Co efflux regulator RcnB
MKRILLAALAVTMLATPAAYAAPQGHGPAPRGDRYEQPRGKDYHRAPQVKKRHHWSKGQRVPKEYRKNVDYRRHHLKAPPRGYQWVENDGQYLMIGIATGLIAAIASAGR